MPSLRRPPIGSVGFNGGDNRYASFFTPTFVVSRRERFNVILSNFFAAAHAPDNVVGTAPCIFAKLRFRGGCRVPPEGCKH